MRLALVVLYLLTAGCGSSPQTTGDIKPFRATDHPGIWVSEGYGHAIVATADSVRLFHVAGDVCVEQPAGQLSLLDFLDLYRRGESDRVLHLSSELDPFEYTFRRVQSVPSPCLAPAEDSPTSNFDALCSYFRHHYVFFDLYGVDWDERSAAARAAITDDMDDQALFEAMSELLRPLKDSHIQIDAEIDGEKFVYDGNPGKTDVAVVAWGEQNGLSAAEATGQFRRGYWIDDIRDTLLMGEGEMTANGRIQYEITSENMGYIAFVSMGGFVDGELETAYEERPVLNAVMDSAMAQFNARNVEAVIVDLSLNIGGYDFIGLDIAGRFAADRTLAYTRRAGDAPGVEDFPLFVEPSPGPRFTGPVYVLTSDLTVSAGEILTLSLRALENVTHAGERTRGAFSTVLTKYLPNGWELSLSNEIYTDPDGVVWEGRGIEPEVAIPVFDQDNPLERHVQAVRTVAGLPK